VVCLPLLKLTVNARYFVGDEMILVETFLYLHICTWWRYGDSMPIMKMHTTGEVFNDGTIIEMVHDPVKDKAEFVVATKQNITVSDQHKEGNKTYLPYSACNNLIKNKIVLLPSQSVEYSSDRQLVSDLHVFVNKYVDLDPLFEKLCVHYILLSWVYDGFNQLPYFRKCGDLGTGKTRFLTVIGSVCYKPIFASGSSSTAALFHILDQFRGTLVLDEADFRYSDERADLTKVLNNGFTKGYPVLRCAFNKNKEFDPVGYQVYGCKLVASRKHFDDPALESRFITEKARFENLRIGIPNELPNSFDAEALELRNKLLTYRLRWLEHFTNNKTSQKIEYIEPRANQIFSPLLELTADEEFRKEIIELAFQVSRQIKIDRAASIEYHVLSVIQSLLSRNERISIGDIAKFVSREFADFHERRITAKWIGYIVSKSLCLKTFKAGGRFYVSGDQQSLLKQLYLRYGVN